ncbi:hypothetical protein TKK_0003206 [Trichogramma kaykai]|uniref:Conserved oligomeric Golgi complex subunit 1 n=1 Tax=Trichogramma kaykai TaxID=54128 RepID=A0ABD2WT51_9HYME
MSSSSSEKYSEQSIEKLFQEHSIREIEQIQKKIQYESDRKQIELRTLVGERYRDLIQAADSIAEMKQTSECVTDKISRIQQTFQELQQKYLIGFKMDVEQYDPRKETSSISDSVVIQIKILMDIPEQIWSAIDEKDFLVATQLFLIAQHIKFSLSFEVGEQDLTSKYPIVFKQWGIINQFKNLILTCCNDALLSVELTIQTAANCLAALVLLDGLNSATLLDRLISLRSQTLQSIFTSESDLSVKSRIKLGLTLLIETIPLIACCFIYHNDETSGLVSLSINGIKDTDAYSMLSKLDFNTDLLNTFLPTITKTHKPFVQHELENLELSEVQEKMAKWLQWVKDVTRTEVTQLLNLITSIKGVYSIREECLAIDIPDNWEFIWEIFAQPSINFWSEFFHPLLTERVKRILDHKMNVCSSNLKQTTSQVLNEVSSGEKSEADLRKFMWSDKPTKLDLSRYSLLRMGTVDTKSPLLMKAKGYSPNVIKLCDRLDADLADVLNHLKQYLYEVEQSIGLKDDLLAADIYLSANKFCDRGEIQDYLQTISSRLVDDFVRYAKSNYVNDEPRSGAQEVNVLVLARFLEAAPQQCTNLKECFAISRSTGIALTSMKWQEIYDRLGAESTAMWLIWAKCFAKRVAKHRQSRLLEQNTENLMGSMIVAEWETIKIEEEAEEGKKITSEISIPYYLTCHVDSYLSAVNADLNKVLPHTIPKAAKNEMINAVAGELLDYFSTLAGNESVKVRQRQAIQILFDVKYATLLMVPRENKPLTEKSAKICASFVAKIDPFDFDVFKPFINANVKKAVQRSLMTYGNLVPHMEQLHSILGARIDHSDGHQQQHRQQQNQQQQRSDPPKIIDFVKDVPYFPLLPIAKPTTKETATGGAAGATAAAGSAAVAAGQSTSDNTQQKRRAAAVKEHSRNDSTGSSIKSGAAAFFAMGSDWFSGGGSSS